MYGFYRFNLLVVALITLASFVTARTVITSQTCTTRFCGYPVHKIYKSTKTICKSTRYTKFRWRTVSKAKSTRTIKTTKTITSQRYTTISRVSTYTSESTIWIGTSTHTRKLTDTIFTASETVTIPVTTRVISASTRTIPAPSGFIGVDDDPDNVGARTAPTFIPRAVNTNEPIPEVELDRRNPEPEPRPEPEPEPEPVAANGRHVTAVICTKTIITKTGTSDLTKITTKISGTVTKTVFVATTTTVPPIKRVTIVSTRTIRRTTSKNKVAFATSKTTLFIYTTSTKYLSTVTSHIPVQTYYESCGTRNRSPRPNLQIGWAAWNAGPAPGEDVREFSNNGTAYDCCVSCHTYNSGGVCVGSLWRSNIWGGDPGCALSNDPDCVDEPFNPEFRSKCHLIIAASSAPALCRRQTYDFYTTGTEPEAVVSNGLTCRRYKFGRFW
ncbi:hypothetical protein TWF730_008699 [Orbilia blumenaviensis]|uniref:Uncharacterized protein n=1 Tax=Orbilia blumenaviensis TaxID=1796055 RepID=A0AAV9V5Q6_9PEZI